MSVTPTKALIDISKLENLADKVRAKTGTSDLMTVDEMATAVENIPSGGLPAEYEAVEYIESTGTQYIDTGYVPSKRTSVILDFNFPVQPTSSNSYMLYGESISRNINDFFAAYANDNKLICKQTWGGTYGSNYLYAALNTTRCRLSFGGGNGAVGYPTTLDQYYLNRSGTPDANAYTNTRNLSMYLFASHEYNNGTESPILHSSIRVYSCKIFDNSTGEMYRNFVPCKRKADDEAGLYDLVNGVFYTNQGTGDFVVPSV